MCKGFTYTYMYLGQKTWSNFHEVGFAGVHDTQGSGCRVWWTSGGPQICWEPQNLSPIVLPRVDQWISSAVHKVILYIYLCMEFICWWGMWTKKLMDHHKVLLPKQINVYGCFDLCCNRSKWTDRPIQCCIRGIPVVYAKASCRTLWNKMFSCMLVGYISIYLSTYICRLLLLYFPQSSNLCSICRQ